MQMRFQFRRYRLPLRVAVRTAQGTWTERTGVVVRLEDAAGHVGWGEASPIAWFGTETVEEIEACCGELGEWTTGEQLAAVPNRLGCLKNALAAARQISPQEPVHKFLGVAALLPAGPGAISLVASKAEIGFRVFKWKVGVGDLADELAMLDDVCAALPSGAKLRLDANGAWDRRQAERWLERCADRPVEFVEQPVAAHARGAMDLLLGLAQDCPTPVALDESLVRDGDIERWIGAGWPGVFVVKLALLGDVAQALERLAAAKAAVVFSSALETAIGAQAALQTAFSWTGEPRALGFGVWPLFEDARFDGPIAAPYLRAEDVQRTDPNFLWNALS